MSATISWLGECVDVERGSSGGDGRGARGGTEGGDGEKEMLGGAGTRKKSHVIFSLSL